MMAKRAREASSSGERWPPEVLPEHTIFLSHSRHDKPFVERLCEELKRFNYTPFFDQNSDSLPKGERFPPHLFKAAEQCSLAVIVLSEGYLTSKWPMLELAAFVKAKATTNPTMKLFPLFYKLSPSDLVPVKWMESWKKLAEDGKVQTEEIESWSEAVQVLVQAKNVETGGIRSSTEHCEQDEIMSDDFPNRFAQDIRDLRPFNGLEFSKCGTSEATYIKAVVDEIWEIIPPVMKYKTDWIRGYQLICHKASSMFEDGIPMNDFCKPGCLYLGLYGMGGVGKTTLCEAMCSFYQVEFRGRVCHVELQGDTDREQLERLKHVIRELGGCDGRVLDGITCVSQGWQCLQDRLKSQPAAFLAVDNVGDSESSRDEARRFISCGLACGSKVMVTSRSPRILESVLGEAEYCKPIPRLEEQEAEELFLSVASPRRIPRPLQRCEDLIVKACIRECRFSDDGYDMQQYHPLVLRALGTFFQGFNMKDWEKAMKVGQKLQESPESKRVNDILGLNYANLKDEGKLLFLDVVFLVDCLGIFIDFSDMECRSLADEFHWSISLLAALHGIETDAAKRRVEDLRLKSLIYESSSSLRTHDLYIEFAQSLVSMEDSKEKAWWVGHKDAKGYNTTLKRLVLHDDESEIFVSSNQLRKCQNLECLIMCHCKGTLSSKLDLKCFPNLRVLIIVDTTETAVLCVGDDAVDLDDNLYGLKNQNKGCLPELRMVHLDGFGCRRIPFLRECWNLTCLSIQFSEMSFDNPEDMAFLENLKKLETLILCGTEAYGFPVSVYSKILECAASMKSLNYLTIQPGVLEGDGSGLNKLDLSALGSLTTLALPDLPNSIEELVGLDQLSQLTTLDLFGCSGLRELAYLDLPPNLLEICVAACEGLEHLEHLEDQLKCFQEPHTGFYPSHQCLKTRSAASEFISS